MIASVDEALATLNLQPGQTYRTQVNGKVLEVRALPAPVDLDEKDAEESTLGEPMLQPWFDIPHSANYRRTTAKRGHLPLSDPPVIPPDEEEIG